MTPTQFAETLALHRARLNHTHQEMAALLGIEEILYVLWEHGTSVPSSPLMLEGAIARARIGAGNPLPTESEVEAFIIDARDRLANEHNQPCTIVHLTSAGLTPRIVWSVLVMGLGTGDGITLSEAISRLDGPEKSAQLAAEFRAQAAELLAQAEKLDPKPEDDPFCGPRQDIAPHLFAASTIPASMCAICGRSECDPIHRKESLKEYLDSAAASLFDNEFQAVAPFNVEEVHP